MKRRRFQIPGPYGKINVTPLIDVVMCLIVFYLIVGRLAADQRSGIRLPETRTGLTEKTQDVLVINILPDGRLVIDTQPIPAEALEGTIRERLAARPDVVVEIRGSRELPYGEVSAVMNACRQAGVASVRLATERAMQ
jgi:biopolymer transport protein ExbD